jgi:ABC-type uncharacterized transport system involved in gliding motility auxiliary subunit
MNRNKFTWLIRKELFSYIIHPLFYIVGVIFTFSCAGYFFIGESFFVAGVGSTDLHRLFAFIPYICILVIPALALGSGTDSHEYLPFSLVKIIFSRWLATFIVFCWLLLPVVFIPICVVFFGDVEIGVIVTGFLGIFFYAACATSLAVFFSELLQQRAAAFVVTALILVCVNLIHFLSLHLTLPDFVVTFIKNISFAWHFDAAGKGILDSRDLFFYSVLTVFFLLLTVYVVKKRRGFRFLMQSGYERLFSIIVIAILFFVFLDSNRYYIRRDFTRSRLFTVSEYGRRLVQNLNEPLRITYYRSAELSRLYPQVRDVSDFLSDYAALNSKISFKLIDPSDKDVGKRLENYGIMSQQLRMTTGNKTEFTDVYSAIVIEYLEKYEIIPFTLTTASLEYDIDSRVQHMVQGITRSAALLSGNNLSLEKDYSYVKPWLESQGFVCSTLQLQEKSSKPDKPTLADELEKLTSGTVLVVLGSSRVSDNEAAAIENFIMNGGAVFFAVSPYKIDISGDWSVTRPKNDAVLSMLSAWGIEFSHQLISDVSCSRITMYSGDSTSQQSISQSHARQLNYPLWLSILPQKNAPNGMTLYWTSPLYLYADTLKPYLVTSPSAWVTEEDSQSPSRLFETNPFILEQTKSSPAGQYTTAAEFEGRISGYYNQGIGKNVKLLVVSDQYFLDTMMMGYTSGEQGDFRNMEFLATALLNLRGERKLAELQSRGYKNMALYKITDASVFSHMQIRVVFFTMIVIPAGFILFGVVIMFIRKKKNKRYKLELRNR